MPETPALRHKTTFKFATLASGGMISSFTTFNCVLNTTFKRVLKELMQKYDHIPKSPALKKTCDFTIRRTMHTSIMFDRTCLPDRAPLGQDINAKTSSACSGRNDREWLPPSTRATLQPLPAKPTGSAGFANSGRVRFSEMHRGRNMRSTKASRSHVRKRRGRQNLAACHEHRAAQVPPPRL
jgi:hypothetical protein